MFSDIHLDRNTNGFKNNVSPGVSRSWEILWRCFPTIRAINFNHEEINSLCNGLTLTDWLHWRFGAFQIAFEPTVSTA
jgi:hypothetical protein